MHSNVLRRHLFDGQFASLYLLSVLRSLTLLFLYLPIYWAFMYMRSTCFSLGMYLLIGNVRTQSFIKIHYNRWQLVFFLVSALFLIGGRSSRMGSWSHSICNTSVPNITVQPKIFAEQKLWPSPEILALQKYSWE